MSKLTDLKNQINNILSSTPGNDKSRNSKYLRDVRYYESELVHNNVLMPFSAELSLLEPEMKSRKVGIHGHTREQYVIHWKGEGKTFNFFLENILAKKERKLLECPDEILRDVTCLIPKVIEAMAQEAKRILTETKLSSEK